MTNNTPPQASTHRTRNVIVGMAAVALVAVGIAVLATSAGDDDAAGSGGDATSTTAPAVPGSTDDAAADPADPEGTPEPSVSAEPTGRAGSTEASAIDNAVSLDEEADFGDGVSASVPSLRAVQGEGVGPGEIGGPAVAVAVTLANDSESAVAVGGAVVNAYFGSDQTPAVPLFGDPRSKPFTGELAAGKSRTATYVFNVPTNKRDDFLVTVSYVAPQPVVAFAGTAPR